MTVRLSKTTTIGFMSKSFIQSITN